MLFSDCSKTLGLVLLIAAVILGCTSGAKEGDKTIVFSYGALTPLHEEALTELLEKFEGENQGINVVLHSLAPVTDVQRLFYHRSFTSKSAFIDVFEMDTIWTAELAAAGALAAPGDRVPAEQLARLERAAVEGASYDGQLMAVPAFPAVSLLYYRKDILAKHKLSPPTTYQELAEMAAKLSKEEGIDGFIWQGDEYEGFVCNFLEVYRAHGGVISNLPKGVTIDPVALKVSLEYLKALVDSGASPAAVLQYREQETRNAFLDGDAVFARDWDDLAGFVEGEDGDVAGKVGLAIIPGTKDREAVPTLGGWHLAVNAKTMYAEQSWKLVEFLARPENQHFMAEKLGRLPADSKVALPDRSGVEGAKVVRLALSLASPRPHSPHYYDLSILLQTELHAALSGTKTIDEAVATLVDKAKDVKLPERAGPDFPRTLLNPSTVF